MIYTVEKIVRKEKLLVTNNFSFLDGIDFKNFQTISPF